MPGRNYRGKLDWGPQPALRKPSLRSSRLESLRMYNCRKVYSAQKIKRYVRKGKGPWFRTPPVVNGLLSLSSHSRLFALAQDHLHLRQVTCSAGKGWEPGAGCLHSQSWLSRFSPLAAHSYSSNHTATGRAPCSAPPWWRPWRGGKKLHLLVIFIFLSFAAKVILL